MKLTILFLLGIRWSNEAFYLNQVSYYQYVPNGIPNAGANYMDIYAQIIDDKNRITLASSCTLEKSISLTSSSATQESSFSVGKNLAQKALSKNIEKVVFDRGSRPYHGRIKSLADGARSVGLLF